jgi:hypothetical protein
MAHGAMLAMPMLVINMGAEMVYVLDQRLKAQSIPRDKSSKVLEDILQTMHNATFMQELFKPHHMYTNAATRQIFDRLAHSSIMRLNATSMDKLYDLMRMGFKFQLLSCASADELLQVTMNHLASTKALIDSADVTRLLDETILLTSQTFGALGAAEWFLLKQFLGRFFQDTRIKVSLFLQNGIQGMDGTLAIKYDGPTASGGRVPGTVRYFDDDGALDEETKFAIATAEDAVAAPDTLDRVSPLGGNMYEADAKGLLKSSARELMAGAKGDNRREFKPHKSFKATASDGLNLLADLLGASAKDSDDRRAFKINLFPDDKANDDDDDKQVPTIWIDASSDRKETDAVRDEFADDDDKGEGKREHDDLLRLMDSTT